MDRFACRETDRQGPEEPTASWKRWSPITVPVGHCYRCKTVVEPLISKQWFVAVKTLAAAAMAAVQDGRTRLIPANWEKTYYDWMTNIRDWCISRQIWWGHRIPAWTCDACGEVIVSREDPAACPDCGGADLVQETDVLDTWFSSALWPFSTLGWPDETPELQALLPHLRPGHRLRHPLFLGGPDDDDGAALHGGGPLPGGLHPRPGPGPGRPEDEQVQGQRHRPPGPHGSIRHRRLPLLPGRLCRHGPGHPPLRGAHRRLPQLRQQGLERLPLHPHEPGGL